ncbi:MAG: acyl-CoA dehydrogenase family protein [Myxococcota bacterium]
MDFSLSEEQQAIGELARQILQDQSTNERQREVEHSDGPRFDAKLWDAVAEAGLLGIAVPEAHGGAGLGFLELSAILEQMGRFTAPIPFYETVVLGALPLAQFGTDTQCQAWLPKLAQGQVKLTAALVADAPTTAARQGDGFTLNGKKLCVPAAAIADLVLVPAEVDGRTTVFLVETQAAGVSLDPLDTTTGSPESVLTLAGVRVGEDAVLGGIGAGDDVIAWLEERATAALCLQSLGLCQASLELTSDYVKTRKQFDQPIAMFQAVGHRAADAYIDTEGIRLTTWQAAWRISAGLDAAKQVAVAKFWCAEGAKRVVHAAAHLHGGVGVDREYPLHRYFLWARQIELTLGGGTPQLRKLGRLLAAEVA